MTINVTDEELRSYTATYLKEEIQAESLTRNIQAFAEFIDMAALSNGEEINYERMAGDCQISTNTLSHRGEIKEKSELYCGVIHFSNI